ncbi:MAG TPA: hypothetical protein VLX29_11515 [Nitrospirota bacterium]|nr:hypothetical protein [Nitrospirota bacterium]
MDNKERELLNQMKAALVFAKKMLLQVQQYTSKHYPDCMMNRYRTGRALAHIEELCPLNEKVFIDSATLDRINGKCREIEEESWGHQEKRCA